ncbi:unnamed protein product [Urochloa decumbens]|uniref:F-box domain-containing protein n=1 Tax=Urochloa decumbens TaxID=240449 RepID=A0ABC8XVS4_9POAL
MLPQKARRRAPEASPTGTLPTELMLQIVARSDAATLFRCAAACKLLRREILSPAFVRRVCREPDGIVPPRGLGFLGDTLSIVRLGTPAAASFAKKILAPFVSRSAGDLLAQYWPQTSRGGLVVMEGKSDMCVYDPMTGERTFLPSPPDMEEPGAEWSDATRAGNPRLPWAVPLWMRGDGPDHEAVVISGVVHWLVREYVLTYDVGTAAVGRIKFPKRCHRYLSARELRLGSTPDGKLRLFGQYRGFTVCSWVLDTGGHDGWSPRAKVDTLPKLMSLSGGRSEYDYYDGYDIERFFRRYDDKVEVEGVGDQRSGVAVLRLANLVFILDMDTREICKISGGKKLCGLPLVVDLPSPLSTMQIF